MVRGNKISKHVMAKSLGSILYIAFLLVTGNSFAQDTLAYEQNPLKSFQESETVSERFDFFFKTSNRYIENSAYDWLDNVNVYLNTAAKVNDSTALRQYKLIQSQIYHDLGDYDKSAAIANELYANKESLDFEEKKVLLDLIDANYEQLALYGKQVEIRQEKRDLGITDNITFYDIYSDLGLHRKAMNDYIMDIKPTISTKEDQHVSTGNEKLHQ